MTKMTESGEMREREEERSLEAGKELRLLKKWESQVTARPRDVCTGGRGESQGGGAGQKTAGYRRQSSDLGLLLVRSRGSHHRCGDRLVCPSDVDVTEKDSHTCSSKICLICKET